MISGSASSSNIADKTEFGTSAVGMQGAVAVAQPGRKARRGAAWRVAVVLSASVALASLADLALAAWLGIGWGPAVVYRRIGPETGPQVFLAGSSLTQFGFLWPDISKAFGRGIENWGVVASSPDIWEVSQRLARNTGVTLIGVSVYDLNELHLSESRARVVPLRQTLADLRQSHADWRLSKRLLDQYLMAYVRALFPTAGLSDKVQVGVRAKARQILRLRSAAQDQENELVVPSKPILQFGDSTIKVSDWDDARMLRRIESLRAENGGIHRFDGPKRVAFRRMLLRARERGPVVVLVLPVSAAYLSAFVDPVVNQQFESLLFEVTDLVPTATLIRLDRLDGLTSNEYFSDLVHLNSDGRRIASGEFLRHARRLPALKGSASQTVAAVR